VADLTGLTGTAAWLAPFRSDWKHEKACDE
jgi:hypothetical protein